jgi:hypothetical protein
MPPCRAHLPRPSHAPLGSRVPTSLRSLASKHSVTHAYKRDSSASRMGTPPPKRHGRRRAELPLHSPLRSRDRSNTLPRSYRSSKPRVLPRIPSNLAGRPDAAAAADPLCRPRSPPTLSPRLRPPAPSREPLHSLPTVCRPNSGETSLEFRRPRRPLGSGTRLQGEFSFHGPECKARTFL